MGSTVYFAKKVNKSEFLLKAFKPVKNTDFFLENDRVGLIDLDFFLIVLVKCKHYTAQGLPKQIRYKNKGPVKHGILCEIV